MRQAERRAERALAQATTEQSRNELRQLFREFGRRAERAEGAPAVEAAPPSVRTAAQRPITEAGPLRAAPKGSLEKLTNDEVMTRLIRAEEQITRESARAERGVTQWTREDPNIQAVRSGTAITADARRAMGRGGQAADRYDRARDVLRERGLSEERIDALREGVYERLGMQAEEGAARFAPQWPGGLEAEAGGIPVRATSTLAGGGVGATIGAAHDEENRLRGAGLGFAAGATAGAFAPRAVFTLTGKAPPRPPHVAAALHRM
ncbi:MAG: hypothetical protein ACYSWU_09050, partial [Planctomycetota bacterium]